MSKEVRVERIYMYGKASAALETFVCALFDVWTNGGYLRTEEGWAEYRAYMDGGDEQVLEDLTVEMGGRGVAFVENRFSYNALMSEGDELVHLCLWNMDGVMSDKEIGKQIDGEYPGCAAFVFVNGDEQQTVPGMWHAHVVVDLIGN